MKKSFISAAAAIAILGTIAVPAVHAQDTSVPVPAPARSSYAPGAAEFLDYAHTYQLSNGQVAEFTQQGSRYYVQVKGSLEALKREQSRGHATGVTQLRPVGPGAFVTDKGTQLRFADEGEQVAISNFERLPAAKVAVAAINVQMIARR